MSKFRESFPCHYLFAANPLCWGLRCDVGAMHRFALQTACMLGCKEGTKEGGWKPGGEGRILLLPVYFGEMAVVPPTCEWHSQCFVTRAAAAPLRVPVFYHLWSQLHHPPPQGLGLRPLGPFVKSPSLNNSNFFPHRDGSCALRLLPLQRLTADGRLFCTGPESKYFKLCAPQAIFVGFLSPNNP